MCTLHRYQLQGSHRAVTQLTIHTHRWRQTATMQANDSAGRYLSTPHAVDRKRDLYYRPALQKNINAGKSKTFGYPDSRGDRIDSDKGTARDKTK